MYRNTTAVLENSHSLKHPHIRSFPKNSLIVNSSPIILAVLTFCHNNEDPICSICITQFSLWLLNCQEPHRQTLCSPGCSTNTSLHWFIDSSIHWFFDSLTNWSFSSQSLKHHKSQTVKVRNLKFWEKVHLPHLSRDRCNFLVFFFRWQRVKLHGEGSVINGAYPTSSFQWTITNMECHDKESNGKIMHCAWKYWIETADL